MGTKLVTGTDGVAAKDLACVDQLGGGGAVSSVTAGTGISVTGTGANPIVNNAGVLSVTAGTGISITGTATAPIVNNTGVLGVTGGANVSVGGTAANPIISAINQQGGWVWIFAFGFGPSGGGNQLSPGASSWLRPYTKSSDFISTGDTLAVDYYNPVALTNVDMTGSVKAFTGFGLANSVTLEVMKNGVASGIGTVISGTGVFSAGGGPIVFAGGDQIGIRQTAGGTVGLSIDYTVTLTGII